MTFDSRSSPRLDPRAPISTLAAASDKPVRGRPVLVAAGAACGAGPYELPLHEAIRAITERSPAACAVQFEGADFSYEWLDDQAERIADALCAKGVEPGDLVAVFMERSAHMLAAILAVLKTGAAYLPLDPAYPVGRLDMIVGDGAPAAMITQAALTGRLDVQCAPVVVIDQLDAAPQRPRRSTAGDFDRLAYVLYTSGSTGRPKGVEITHRAVMNLLASFEQELGLGPNDVTLAATTTSFDISVVELFMPLVSGGRIVMAASDTVRNPEKLAALIDGSDCNIAQATPSMWRYLIEAGWMGKRGLTIVSGGEALTRELADRLLQRCDVLWNVYGPTETTVWSTIARIDAGEGPPPIGRPIANTTVHILDQAGQPAPQGQVGELYIGGLGLARGYRNRPDLTAERFVMRAGERLYRTGDLAALRPSGELDCLGRIDHQVKIRGHRVELGELEAALSRCETVAWAAATVFPDPDGNPHLIAYVTPRQDQAVDVNAIRKDLAAHFPPYMVPAQVVELAAMPMTDNRKIDRKALPPPDFAITERVETVGDGLTQTEAKLVQIWGSILGLRAISATDNFFDLGGYSLLTVSLLKRIEAAFGRKLSLSMLFAVQDLRAMAALIDDPQDLGEMPRHIALQPQGWRPPLIWFDVGAQLRRLAERMAPDQPFLGINIEPAEEVELAKSDDLIAGVAARLVTALRSVQPSGPYYIGGWCRWGVVAYAAARALMDQGETVALLVMLDSVNSGSAHQVLRRTKHAVRRRLRPLARLNATRLQVVVGFEPILAPEETSFSLRVGVAAERYRPRPYAGDVLLLRASDAEEDWDGKSGWSQLVRGRMTTIDLPGEHSSILKPPHIDALAAALRTELDRAQRG